MRLSVSSFVSLFEVSFVHTAVLPIERKEIQT